MADTDEAAIHLPSNDSAPHFETDLSDETQDFRMLNNISFLTDSSHATLPKRGEKDFEPNPTLLQADVLAASREAMHNALAHPRLHNPKNTVVGYYMPDGPTPPPSVVATPKTAETTAEDAPEPSASQDNAETKPQPKNAADTGLGNVFPDSCVCVPNPKGNLFKTTGRADRWNRVWLLPEEALYLLERGSLDIRWPASSVGCDESGDTEEPTIPMSLQAAYACFVASGGLTVERFSVYTGLKRLGYSVFRAPGWYDDAEEPAPAESPQPQGPGLAGIYERFLDWFHKPNTTALGPVAGLGIHRNYKDVYRKLAIIPWYDPVAPKTETPRTSAPFRVVFHIYKPSTAFRKTAPPPPDFRIAVVDAREQTTMPTMAQIGSLLDNSPLEPPEGEKMSRALYMRLRQGYRSVILAVVDQGVVSYLRVADAAFGKEKLYAFEAPQGNKKGGFSRPKPKGR
ncbi:tRNA-splicing endonuclease subunit SEN54 family protein [Aspergillus melleus]|uniref:tRNA-splicing endonuclease subunit SEN54 family protein n=1 Tax=Aspergillus melleus TaxID=138277 RepID=UPI001E8D8D8D|nr:tRNA-splicing endonuclease subunit sen54 [Aspergillus melleus]KAH8425014.1 tRNA-splicing endonuclease subunit sen54 [Aspergillus melleus]